MEVISAYLPYSLECKVIDKGIEKIAELDGVYSCGSCVFHDIVESHKGFSEVKPILRPLSDLVKGSFPSSLIKVIIQKGVYKNSFAKGHERYSWKILQKPFGKIFKIQNHDEWVCLISFKEPDRVSTYVYNWLLKNHFDVFGLIEKGEAIDVNSIEEWK